MRILLFVVDANKYLQWTILNYKQVEEDKLDQQSEATMDLVESIQFYIDQYKHTFLSKKEMSEHIHYMCEAVLQNSTEKN